MSQYPNRSDLRNAVARPQYGELKAQEPLRQLAGPPPVPEVPQGPEPGARGPLGRPSERPDEPLTAGAPFGEGPGPEALAPFVGAPPPAGSAQDAVEKLRALVAIAPNANLIAVLREAERLARRGG